MFCHNLSVFLLIFPLLAHSTYGVADFSHKDEDEIQVLMIFTKAEKNSALHRKFQLTVHSMIAHSTAKIRLHIVGDDKSRKIAETIFRSLPENVRASTQLQMHEMESLAQGVADALSDLITYFRYSKNSYYGDNLFFISMVLDRVFPKNFSRIIQLDSDLKFRGDIAKLWAEFDNFTPTNIIGLARETQPVYRHMFSEYRRKNPTTIIGDPPPNGVTGFNSGVILLNLKAMRASKRYKNLLNRDTVESLVHKYKFQGHLGDQDFYTLLSTENMDLFYTLSCVWNRQLCTWWRDHGYKAEFDDYYKCEGDVMVYHGNCNTPIPED